MLAVERHQVIAFRLAAQAARPTAAALQDYPAGAAEAALALRGASADGLVRTWSLRGTAHLVSPDALAAFTRGLLPRSEREMRSFVAGAGHAALDGSGRTRTEAVAETRAAIAAALSGGPLTRDVLHEELRKRLAPELLMDCPRCGTRHSPPMVWRTAALDGTYVMGPPRGRQPTFVLAGASDGPAPERLAAELVRRYLGWFGPSSAQELAPWAGISAAQAKRMWRLVEDELAAVTRDGHPAWLLERDLTRLRAASPPPGVVLLAAGDPLLTARDRETLAPDEGLRRALFRPAGSPGAVLVDGELRGTWRARLRGSELVVATDVDGVRPEHAAHLAAARGVAEVTTAR
jgi:hypothetical protein